MHDVRFPPREDRVDDILLRQRRERPQRIFLKDGARTLGFEETAQAVERVAAGLRGLGIGAGDTVALMLPNGIDFVLAWMGCARVGALAAFLNPSYQGAMLDYVLGDSMPKGMITHADVEPMLASADPAALARIEWLCVIGGRDGGAGHGTRRIGREALFDAEATGDAGAPGGSADAPNCVIYTSGTTGPSKGAVLTTSALLAGSRTFVALSELTEDDVLYTPLPLFHGIASRQGVMGCLIGGAQIVIGPRFSASRFWDEVRQADATLAHTMFNIPAMLKAQPPHPQERSHRLRAMYNAQHDAVFEERFGVPLLEAYGLIETGITIFSPCSRRKPGSCGRLHPDWEARIVDAQGQVLADGEVGELWMRPKHPRLFMNGYLNKPEATLGACRDFWFHTGDFVSRDAEGFYYFAGRQKERIRRRGENISAFEIERVASAHPEVNLCAAMGHPAEVGDDDVRLVLLPKEGAELDAEKLADWFSERLPRFMVPRYYEIVTELPLTPTEKVKKNELIDRGFVGRVWDRERSAWLAPVQAGTP